MKIDEWKERFSQLAKEMARDIGWCYPRSIIITNDGPVQVDAGHVELDHYHVEVRF